ncbi:MAG TPA: alkaline phosphatase family protein [Polyangiaceae bacterium]|nr:alkaline phosphatase family protein [Polyangiaceae bacterium]
MVSNAQLRELVDTVVVVMLENRSFDHTLGFLSHELFDQRADIDGLHQHSDVFDWDNPDAAGQLYAPTATPDSYLPRDLPHSRRQIAQELDSGAMDGFIRAYFDDQTTDRSPIPMRFCRPQDVPVTAALARNFTVCDRWFASLPTDTQPNRLMAVSGQTLIDATSSVSVPFHLLPNQFTIFDYLESKGIPFNIYVDASNLPLVGVPSCLLLMKSQWRHVVHRGHSLQNLAQDWQSAAPAPNVIYCEPFYNDFATALNGHGNCNHPPLPMAFGEDFLGRVYSALTSNPEKWKKTVLFVCYDEHGGFFDHVAPPGMKYNAPPAHQWVDTTAFMTFGVRVPGMVISPLVERGSAFHGLLDHTSILQLMVDRFGRPEDLARFGHAPARKANRVHSLADVITRTEPRADASLAMPQAPAITGMATTPSLSQTALMFRAVMADRPATQV